MSWLFITLLNFLGCIYGANYPVTTVAFSLLGAGALNHRAATNNHPPHCGNSKWFEFQWEFNQWQEIVIQRIPVKMNSVVISLESTASQSEDLFCSKSWFIFIYYIFIRHGERPFVMRLGVCWLANCTHSGWLMHWLVHDLLKIHTSVL